MKPRVKLKVAEERLKQACTVESGGVTGLTNWTSPPALADSSLFAAVSSCNPKNVAQRSPADGWSGHCGHIGRRADLPCGTWRRGALGKDVVTWESYHGIPRSCGDVRQSFSAMSLARHVVQLLHRAGGASSAAPSLLGTTSESLCC